MQHIKRANYQEYIWRRALEATQELPSPNNNGWTIQDDMLQPVLMTKDPAPHALLELSFCRCKKSACRRADCSCKINNLGCTDGCLCSNSESCENSRSTLYTSHDESDENL